MDSHDPHKFFTSCNAIYFSDEFERIVLAGAKPVENLDAATLRSSDLTVDANDVQIASSLGENHLFDVIELCARIEQMISKQLHGEEGDLLTNGRWNLFFCVEGYVVGMFWDAQEQEWYLDAWDDLGRGRWAAGRRAFASN